MNLFLIGLGNPGIQYINNRHNIGHIYIDYLKGNVKKRCLAFYKTTVFMNNSGTEVKKVTGNFSTLKNSVFVIVHDDLDIRLGNFKIQKGTGPKVHNGLSSIEDALGTKDFWRIRIGVDNRDSDHRGTGEDYVLSDFTIEEKQVLETIFPQILSRLILVQKNIEKT